MEQVILSYLICMFTMKLLLYMDFENLNVYYFVIYSNINSLAHHTGRRTIPIFLSDDEGTRILGYTSKSKEAYDNR